MSYYEISKKSDGVTFPEYTTNPKEKGKDYILQYGKAMYGDWTAGRAQRFYNYREQIKTNRDYAIGLQDIEQYKSRMGDEDVKEESFLNLDWRILSILPNFIGVSVGKLMKEDNQITCTAIDPLSVKKKNNDYWNKYADIKHKERMRNLEAETGHKFLPDEVPDDPQTTEELDVWFKLFYKQRLEIAMEMGIDLVFYLNYWREIEKQVKRSLLVDGIACVKDYFLDSGFIKIRPCDAYNLVLDSSYMSDFRNMRHVGEVVSMPMHELHKQAGSQFSDEDYEVIAKKFTPSSGSYYPQNYGLNSADIMGTHINHSMVPVMEFEFKSTNAAVYQQKSKYGNNHLFERDHEYNPDETSGKTRMDMEYEVIYTGCWIVGTDFIFNYGLQRNMVRNPSALYEASFSFHVVAPDMIDGQIVSRAERCIPLCNSIQLSWLKIQNLKAEAAPKGVSIDINGLMNVPTGKGGQNWQPLQLIKLRKQRGDLLYNSAGKEGRGMNNQKPIEEMENGLGQQLQEWISCINFDVEMIRSVTGINEVADASTPNPNQPVGTSKLALMATMDTMVTLVEGYKRLKEQSAKSIGYRLQLVSKDKKAASYVEALGESAMMAISLEGLDLAEIGVKVEDVPTDSDRAFLEQMIMQSLSIRESTGANGIDIEDAMFIRRIPNVKLAEQVLLVRRRRRQSEDMKQKQMEQQAVSQGNAQAAEAAEEAKRQTEEFISDLKIKQIDVEQEWGYRRDLLKLFGDRLNLQDKGHFDSMILQQGSENKLEETKQASQLSLRDEAAQQMEGAQPQTA